MEATTRIFLADGEARVRYALGILIARSPRFLIVGSATTGPELEERIVVVQPDVLLLDWTLPGASMAKLTASLKRRFPNIIIVASSSRPEHRPAALGAGADDFISKIDGPDQLLDKLLAHQSDSNII